MLIVFPPHKLCLQLKAIFVTLFNFALQNFKLYSMIMCFNYY